MKRPLGIVLKCYCNLQLLQGEIKATGFHEAVDRFYEKIETGKVIFRLVHTAGKVTVVQQTRVGNYGRSSCGRSLEFYIVRREVFLWMYDNQKHVMVSSIRARQSLVFNLYLC